MQKLIHYNSLYYFLCYCKIVVRFRYFKLLVIYYILQMLPQSGN